jgi:uncharacterized protein YjbJ (UPF0337 family)
VAESKFLFLFAKDSYEERDSCSAVVFLHQTRGDHSMDREHVKGAADKIKGTVKDTVGQAMGDEKLQAEGKMDKVKGDIRKGVGDVKDALKE